MVTVFYKHMKFTRIYRNWKAFSKSPFCLPERLKHFEKIMEAPVATNRNLLPHVCGDGIYNTQYYTIQDYNLTGRK